MEKTTIRGTEYEVNFDACIGIKPSKYHKTGDWLAVYPTNNPLVLYIAEYRDYEIYNEQFVSFYEDIEGIENYQ